MAFFPNNSNNLLRRSRICCTRFLVFASPVLQPRINGYLLQKIIIDVILFVFWLPGIIIKTADVTRHLCPPVWTDIRCFQYIHSSFWLAIATTLIVAVVLGLVYRRLYDRILSVSRPEEAPDILTKSNGNSKGLSQSEKMHLRLFRILAVFLWLHLYLSCAFVLTLVSLGMWFVGTVCVVGMLHTIFLLNRVHDWMAPSSKWWRRWWWLDAPRSLSTTLTPAGQSQATHAPTKSSSQI